MRLQFITGMACLFFLWSCGEKQNQEQSATYPTMTVKLGNKMLETDYTATIQGRQTVDVRPQVSGNITQICIKEGASVRKGQTLFIIDQVPYKAALETAVANVESAKAKLSTAQMNYDSKQILYQEKVVSEFDLQTTRNALLEAKAALSQAKAEETNARNNLSYTVVKSPVDGVAGMIPYRVGALVNSSITDPLVTVSDDQEVYAYFSMTENQVLDMMQKEKQLSDVIRTMPAVKLKLSNGTLYPHEGKIDAISGNIDTSTGSISVRAVYPNKEQLLRNGSSGMVVIPSEHKNCIIIPQEATYELQNKVFVYKVINGKASSTPIEVVEISDGKEYIVTSGLKPGDVIISEGAGLVKEGAVVSGKQPKGK
ncbi:MAG: efflux RND transporter periplasmic adaptor subunit [Paraprevotella sp.]|nr:efflux RND transporter periplasmic adaptor subunit [Paraprevotella sp.]